MTQEVVRGLLTSKHLGGSVPFGRSLHFFGFRFPYSSNDRTEPEKLAYWCKLPQSRNRLDYSAWSPSYQISAAQRTRTWNYWTQACLVVWHFSSLCFTGEMFSYKLKVRLPTSKDITAHCIGTAWNRTRKISEVGLCSVTITTGMKCPETANLAIKSETKKRSFFLLRHKH